MSLFLSYFYHGDCGVFSGIKIVRPTHRGLIERLGKYNRFAQAGVSLDYSCNRAVVYD